MKLTGGRIAGGVLLLCALTACAVFVAPRVEATSAKEPMRAALESALGRKVEFRSLSYRLFPFPGLAASDLVIAEDEAFGIEPLAYVTELYAGLKWLPLLRGRYELSRVRLYDASINLSRDPNLGWNVGRLIEWLAQGGSRSGAAPPRLMVRAGRINFRSGTLKSPYYLNNVTLDLDAPPEPGGVVRWSYEASPARTDRAEQGFGRFSGSGDWDPRAGPEGLADIEVELERSVINEVLTLIVGRDPGVQGWISGRGRLRGPLNKIAIAGQLQVADLDRPGLFGFGARNLVFPYEGRLDLAAQEFEIHSAQPQGADPSPIQLEFAAGSILVNPRWRAQLKLQRLPAVNAVDLARRFGAGLPAGLLSGGDVEGLIHATQESGVEGQFTFRDVTIPLGEPGAARVPEAQILFGPEGLDLRPTPALSPSGAEAEIRGKWNPAADGIDFSISGAGLPLGEIVPALEVANVSAPLPALSACSGGTLSGSIRFESSAAAPPRWSGAAQVSRLACRVDGLPEPLMVERGSLSMDGSRWWLRRASGVAGELEWEGDIARMAGGARPWRAQITIPAASLAQLERIFTPLLPAPRGLLDRTLRFRRRPVPPWLADGGVEGGLRIQALQAGDLQLWALKSKLFWDTAGLELAAIDARWKDAGVSGRAAIRGDAAAPSYSFRGRVEGLEWQEGKVDAEVDVLASGPAVNIGARLQASGLFTARGLALGEEKASYAAGAFEYAPQRGGPALRLRSLEIHMGGEILVGRGASAEGKVAVEASGPRHTLRLQGTLDPFALEPAQGEAERTR